QLAWYYDPDAVRRLLDGCRLEEFIVEAPADVAEVIPGAARREVAGRPGDGVYPLTLDTRLVDVDEDALRKFAGILREAGWRPPAAEVETSKKRPEYLTSWQEILTALGLKNNDAMRAKVRQLDEMFSSPILFGGQGEQPRVERRLLILWWDG